MSDIKISSMLFTWNGVGDRFIRRYFEPKPIEDILPELAGTRVRGVELQNPNHVTMENVARVKELLATNGLEPVVVNIPMAGDLQWTKGSFSSTSAETRRKAVERVKAAVDVSRELGTGKVSLFLGQDGFDYPLTSDYRRVWKNLVECFDECAAHAPDVRFCIEYKPREPRCRQFLSTAAKTLLLAEETGRKNIGLLVDVGHAWMAGENVAEVICLAAHKERLFHVHMNDNFRLADDDLGVGAVHFAEYLEALYWLDEVGYDGWVSLDVHSPREVSREIIAASADYLYALNAFLNGVGRAKVRELVDSGDGSRLVRFVTRELLGGRSGVER